MSSDSALGLNAGFSAACTDALILAARAHYFVASARAERGLRWGVTGAEASTRLWPYLRALDLVRIRFHFVLCALEMV